MIDEGNIFDEYESHFYLDYEVGCRSCFWLDGPYSDMILNENVEDYIRRTEYSMMHQIANERMKSGIHICENCGSFNLEIYNIKVNDTPLFDFDKLMEKCAANHKAMLLLYINKDNHGSTIGLDGSIPLEQNIFEAAIKEMIIKIRIQSNNQFLSKTKGNFNICVTAKYNNITRAVTSKVETLRFAGFSKNEILRGLEAVANERGIDITSVL